MIDLREPIYQWGQRVCAAVDLVNDGSHPGVPADALLAAAGTEGEIVNVGHHADSNTPVYLVEFAGETVVGCFEEELVPAQGG
ncbi:MAG: nitrogen fixation protein NifZ [Novosphingobium sp.]|nr:nitrogen fixation protein NifZ [Novosphingobium sp.]MCP5401323.1 nitrogen fixation protein NifZ [Novosphingobium sp.]